MLRTKGSISSIGPTDQQRRLQVADKYSQIAGEAFQAGDFNTAAVNYSQALTIEKETLSTVIAGDGRVNDRHPRIAMTYFNLAVSYFANGDYDDARQAYLKALEIEKELLQKVLMEEMSDDISNSGAKSVSKLKISESDRVKRKQENVAMTYYNLSLTDQEMGRYESALKNALEALALFRSALGGSHVLSKNADIQANELKKVLEAERRASRGCWYCCKISDAQKMQNRLRDRQMVRDMQSKEMQAMNYEQEKSKSSIKQKLVKK